MESNKHTCCECEHCMLWWDYELLCILKDECVDGNDNACQFYTEEQSNFDKGAKYEDFGNG